MFKNGSQVTAHAAKTIVAAACSAVVFSASAAQASDDTFDPVISAPFGPEDAVLAVTGPGPDSLIGGAMLMNASADMPESSKPRRPVKRPDPVDIDRTAILDVTQARNAVATSNLSVEFAGAEVFSAEGDLLGHIEQVIPYEGAQIALTVAPAEDLDVGIAAFTLAVPNDALTGATLRTAIPRDTLIERLEELAED